MDKYKIEEATAYNKALITLLDDCIEHLRTSSESMIGYEYSRLSESFDYIVGQLNLNNQKIVKVIEEDK